jgi:hypothetical protein
VLAAIADAKPTKETHMKRQLKQTGILAAGLFCATQALAGWTDVADEKELRAAGGLHVPGPGHLRPRVRRAFEQDGSAKVEIGGRA